MTFVNELVPEADKSRIDFGSINYPMKGFPVSVYKWTIDRERDVFLMRTRPGGADYPEREFFVLGWKGQLIRMELEMNVSGDAQLGYVYTWHMRQLLIPEHLQAEREEILQAVKEALDVYGDTYQRNRILVVNFQF